MMTQKNLRKCLILIIFIVVAMPLQGQACTTFFLDHDGSKVFGKNYDWHLGHGLIIINQHGVKKTAMAGMGHDSVKHTQWTSKYGSLTFNQYGREMPTGGMNEAGLVVHLMMLSQTQYPEPDARNPIKDLQWIQYQLDNFSSVKQVIEHESKIRILNNEVPGLHFLIADKTGNSATIEWLNGKFVCHTDETMPVKALTNSTYKDSLKYLQRHKGFGGTMKIDSSSMSLDRFVRTAEMLKSYPSQPEKPLVEYAFDILKNVSDESTKWSIVYDLEKLTIYFKTSLNKNIRSVDLPKFDMSCSAPIKVINLDSKLSGDISDSFINYTRQMNQKMINIAFKRTSFVSNIPEITIHQRIVYPESTTCDQ